MSSAALQDRSDRLASLVDGLGAALRAGGVPDDAAARVLEKASAAVLDALTLEVMLAEVPPPRRAAATVQQPEAGPSLTLAA